MNFDKYAYCTLWGLYCRKDRPNLHQVEKDIYQKPCSMSLKTDKGKRSKIDKLTALVWEIMGKIEYETLMIIKEIRHGLSLERKRRN